MPKLMPTLRHTKSEEYLESNGDASSDNSNEVKIHIDKVTDATSLENIVRDWSDDDVWSQEEDEITAQYLNMRKISEKDSISELSVESIDSREQAAPTSFNIGDVRNRHRINLHSEIAKPFSNDPEDPSAAALKVRLAICLSSGTGTTGQKLAKLKISFHSMKQTGTLA